MTADARANPEKTTAAVDVICAFCGGTGKDPFDIMSPLATCQVCGGTGRRMLHPPTAPCAFCQGTGVHPLYAVTCPCCGGSGRAADYADYIWPDSPLSCPCCGGKGVVAK
jgi:DnaJ-class molecular chaperone